VHDLFSRCGWQLDRRPTSWYIGGCLVCLSLSGWFMYRL
jgi:hypothetical protein